MRRLFCLPTRRLGYSRWLLPFAGAFAVTFQSLWPVQSPQAAALHAELPCVVNYEIGPEIPVTADGGEAAGVFYENVLVVTAPLMTRTVTISGAPDGGSAAL